MKLPISFLLLAAIGLTSSEVARENKTSYDKSIKRELYEGNYGLRNGLAFETKYRPEPRSEYAEDNKETSDKSDARIYEERVPQISKISDLLTGQGPFEVAVANHLYSPVSVYQARHSSPTTYGVPDAADQGRKIYNQSQQQTQKFQQKTPAQQKQPGYDYKNPLPEYTREESKLLHLETAFPRLEPSRSASVPYFPDEVLIQPLSNIQPQLYPQFSFQKIEHVPLRYPDGTLQPIQYYQQSLVNLIPIQSELMYENQGTGEETDNGLINQQDNRSTERPEQVQSSTEAPNQEYVDQQQSVSSFYPSQAYAPSQQYLPVPRPLEPTNQPLLTEEQELIQIPQEIQYQQYQQYLQTPQELAPQIEVVQIQQTTPQPNEILSTEPVTIFTSSTLSPESQPSTFSTFKPLSEFSTSPTTTLISEVQTTTLAPQTTHKPLSRPMVPLRPLPGSRAPLQPRPFSIKQPTTQTTTRFTTFAPLPTYRRFSYLNNRRLTSTLQSSITTPTITNTPQPTIKEIFSTQSLPTSTSTVSRTPIIRIRHKPSYSTTTPLPTPSLSTTLETLLQPTTTIRPSTTLEPVTYHTTQTPEPDRQTAGIEYISPPELPHRPQPGVIYHLQKEPEIQVTSSPPPLLNPFPQPNIIQEALQSQPLSSPKLSKMQSLSQPDIQRVLQPIQAPLQPIQASLQSIQAPFQPIQAPLQPIQPPLQPIQAPLQPIQAPLQPIQAPLQPYPDEVEIEESPRTVLPPSLQFSLVQPTPQTFQYDVPQPREFQPFLRPGLFQLYQPPVFNLRPQYQPLSTPLPPTQSTLIPQPLPILQLETSTPSPVGQQKYIAPKLKSKPFLKGDTYLPPRVSSPNQPILQPHLYTQSRELYFRPDYPVAAPTFPSVQYFGKYAEAIFGHLTH